MPDYIDYPSPDPNDGTDLRKLGFAMVFIALLGGGLIVTALMLEQKSPDPLYDTERADHLTSARVQVTPDLWRGKHETPIPDEPQRWTPPAPPAEPAKPTTRPGT